MPKVSVIVPTKNSSRTLDACLRSVKAQTYGDVELIVVDNPASDDLTRGIAAAYADIVMVVGPERSTQRNEGLRRATGDYVVFVDSDMVLSPHVIGACVTFFESQSDIAGIVIPEDSFGEGFWAECKAFERSFYEGVSWMEAARFFRRADVVAGGGYDEALVSGEDWDLSQRMERRGRIVRVRERIGHDEGRLTLSGLLRKKSYYARQFVRYSAKTEHSSAYARQGSAIARYMVFFSSPRKLLARPLLSIGMLFMKTCEFAAWGSAKISFLAERKNAVH